MEGRDMKSYETPLRYLARFPYSVKVAAKGQLQYLLTMTMVNIAS
jgi:hypothetical protein